MKESLLKKELCYALEISEHMVLGICGRSINNCKKHFLLFQRDYCKEKLFEEKRSRKNKKIKERKKKRGEKDVRSEFACAVCK